MFLCSAHPLSPASRGGLCKRQISYFPYAACCASLWIWQPLHPCPLQACNGCHSNQACPVMHLVPLQHYFFLLLPWFFSCSQDMVPLQLYRSGLWRGSRPLSQAGLQSHEISLQCQRFPFRPSFFYKNGVRRGVRGWWKQGSHVFSQHSCPARSIAIFYLGSNGYFAFTQSSKPPFRALTFLKPLLINIRATRALVASSSHVQ